MDQRCQQAGMGSRAGADKKAEVPDEVRVCELVQTRQEEFDAERRLDHRGGCKTGVATGGNAFHLTLIYAHDRDTSGPDAGWPTTRWHPAGYPTVSASPR